MNYIDKSTFVTIPQDHAAKIETILGFFSKPKTDADIFYNLCFTLMAPQMTFKKNRETIETLKRLDYFNQDLSKDLPQIIRASRFYNVRSKRLEFIKSIFNTEILPVIRSMDLTWKQKRDWVYNNIDGFGLKASSHFLRNLGCRELPIIDIHIIRFLMGKKPSNEKQYRFLEDEFVEICKNKDVVPAALDAYVWAVFSNTDYSSFDY